VSLCVNSMAAPTSVLADAVHHARREYHRAPRRAARLVRSPPRYLLCAAGLFAAASRSSWPALNRGKTGDVRSGAVLQHDETRQALLAEIGVLGRGATDHGRMDAEVGQPATASDPPGPVAPAPLDDGPEITAAMIKAAVKHEKPVVISADQASHHLRGYNCSLVRVVLEAVYRRQGAESAVCGLGWTPDVPLVVTRCRTQPPGIVDRTRASFESWSISG
jgi:hypothetical protein